MFTIFHVFTDNKDYYLENKKIAKRLFHSFSKINGSARLYEVTFDSHEMTEESEQENCIMSFGRFPN